MSGLRAGMTMIELLLTLLILSVIISIVWPPLANSRSALKAATSARAFEQTFALARSAAVRFGRVSELRVDPAQGRYWVEVDTGGAAPVAVGPVHVVEEPVTVASENSRFCFDARGIRTGRESCGADLSEVIFSVPETADTVVITPVGMVVR